MMRLECGDCNELLKTVPDKSIDLIMTDPPYLFNSTTGGGKFGTKGYFDGISKLNEGISNETLDEIMRVLKKPNLYVWCNWKQARQYLDYFEGEHKLNTNLLCWHKSNPVPLCSNKFLNDTEYIIYARGKGVKLSGGYTEAKTYWTTKLNTEDKKKYDHPTIKPLEISKTLIGRSTIEGEVVLDPFMGSGTTGVACKLLNRDFIGFELNEKHFTTAKNRINEERLI